MRAARPRRASRRLPSPGANSTQQQIRLALAQAEAEVASLRVRAGDMQARLAQLRASATRVPQIEAEMAQLNRDYEVIKGAYQTMVSRREKAALSEDVDATRSAQFQIIDPPRTAPQPVFPNRPALSVLVVFLALVAGIAGTFLAANLSPTFDSARLLGEATHRKVLGSVSMVMNADHHTAGAGRKDGVRLRPWQSACRCWRLGCVGCHAIRALRNCRGNRRTGSASTGGVAS